MTKKTNLLIASVVVIVSAMTAFSGARFGEVKSTKVPVENQTANVGSIKTFTLVEVSKHHDGASCWTAIDSVVYDVTAWISQHPGGEGAILSLCGIDGSDAFNGQHGGQRRPANELAAFKIGNLVQ